MPEVYKTAQDFSLGVKLACLTSFAETSALCCIQPADSMGLSADKGRMFRETVCLALALGQEQGWPAPLPAASPSRATLEGRRNYLRRHVEGRQGFKLTIGILAIGGKNPLLLALQALDELYRDRLQSVLMKYFIGALFFGSCPGDRSGAGRKRCGES